jgi:maleylacetate reductase
MATEPRSAGQPEIHAGPGAFEALPEVCAGLGARRVLLVGGGSCAPLAARAADLLGARVLGTWSHTPAHVPSREVNIAVASAQEIHADAVVSIGGGAATGFGKIVAFALRIPLVAVPTTYTGAEMTTRYLVTTDRGKEAGASPRARPRVVIHDPELTATLPAGVVASSAMTAVASCLGALMRGASDGDMSDGDVAEARSGLQLLWHGVPALRSGHADSAVRAQLLRGAALAGRTLERTGPGLPQLLAEELGGGLGADHGAALGCLVGPALAAAGPEAGPARAYLQELTGRADPAEVLLAELVREWGLPGRLTEICRVGEPVGWARRAVDRPEISAHADVQAVVRLLAAA